MKLAHLILAHKDPAMLERLVKRLQHKDADIFIQLDSKTDITQFKYIEDIPNTYFIVNRGDIGYCNYSTIAVTLQAMEEILLLKNDYSHINLLSGQDYPLKPIETIQQHFFANAGKSFCIRPQLVKANGRMAYSVLKNTILVIGKYPASILYRRSPTLFYLIVKYLGD
jgi:hypothetical protein